MVHIWDIHIHVGHMLEDFNPRLATIQDESLPKKMSYLGEMKWLNIAIESTVEEWWDFEGILKWITRYIYRVWIDVASTTPP